MKAVEAWRSGSADPEKQSRAKALKLAAQMDAQHATRASRLHREQEEAERLLIEVRSEGWARVTQEDLWACGRPSLHFTPLRRFTHCINVYM